MIKTKSFACVVSPWSRNELQKMIENAKSEYTIDVLRSQNTVDDVDDMVNEFIKDKDVIDVKVSIAPANKMLSVLYVVTYKV